MSHMIEQAIAGLRRVQRERNQYYLTKEDSRKTHDEHATQAAGLVLHELGKSDNEFYWESAEKFLGSGVDLSLLRSLPDIKPQSRFFPPFPPFDKFDPVYAGLSYLYSKTKQPIIFDLYRQTAGDLQYMFPLLLKVPSLDILFIYKTPQGHYDRFVAPKLARFKQGRDVWVEMPYTPTDWQDIGQLKVITENGILRKTRTTKKFISYPGFEISMPPTLVFKVFVANPEKNIKFDPQ